MIIFKGACRPDSGLQALGYNIEKSKWYVKSALEKVGNSFHNLYFCGAVLSRFIRNFMGNINNICIGIKI